MDLEPVLIAGEWVVPQPVNASSTVRLFQSVDPATRQPHLETFPITGWADVQRMLQAATEAFHSLSRTPPEQRAAFLTRFAERIEAAAAELVAIAHSETALPVEPRLAKAELPRTANQLRLGARAAVDRSWTLPTIDRANGVRSMLGPLGPIVVFGPNNFPFAFNAVSGGDFVAAIVAGNPVVAKANPGHPKVTQRLAQEAFAAISETGLHPATLQLFYQCDPEVGLRICRHPAVGAVAFTGSKSAGLALKKAADEVGKPIYLELGSINPVVVLPGALQERLDALVGEFTGSCLMGAGQFCTNPGLVLLVDSVESEQFIAKTAQAFRAAPIGTLLGERVLHHLQQGVAAWGVAGAQIATGGRKAEGRGFHFENTVARTSAQHFLANSTELQTEAFGNACLCVVCADEAELLAVLESIEGNLTGSVFSHSGSADDALYERIEPALRRKVGRLLNDRMPTGVAVSPAMNHGGPYPASGHPGFTAVGLPASVRRFAALWCYDNVREGRLPVELRNRNLSEPIWRLVDGAWTKDDVS